MSLYWLQTQASGAGRVEAGAADFSIAGLTWAEGDDAVSVAALSNGSKSPVVGGALAVGGGFLFNPVGSTDEDARVAA